MKKDFISQLKNRRGVSPVLATVMIFGLIITGVMITFVQVVPYIQQAQSEEAIASVRNSFLELDTTIKSLLSESGAPGGFRTILFTKPSGVVQYVEDRYYISLRLLDQDSNTIYKILDEKKIGVLDWVFNSPRSVIPRGTTKYLTGPDPYRKREPVFLTGTFSSTDYQDLTNLTLSHLNDKRHHVTLNYRISIYLTISTQPEPEIRFEVFLVLISSDFDSFHRQYQQITIHSYNNFSRPYTLPENDSIGAIELVWDNIKTSGSTTTSLWSTQLIQGFNVQYFNIVVQTLVYEIGLSIS
ncbi:MAG: hypothetical protein ACFFB2_11390 [Promethearchaeota archaeon]